MDSEEFISVKDIDSTVQVSNNENNVAECSCTQIATQQRRRFNDTIDQSRYTKYQFARNGKNTFGLGRANH